MLFRQLFGQVEFEFTVNGKVDLPNACLVFTERASNMVKDASDRCCQLQTKTDILYRLNLPTHLSNLNLNSKLSPTCSKAVALARATCSKSIPRSLRGRAAGLQGGRSIHGARWHAALRWRRELGADLQRDSARPFAGVFEPCLGSYRVVEANPGDVFIVCMLLGRCRS